MLNFKDKLKIATTVGLLALGLFTFAEPTLVAQTIQAVSGVISFNSRTGVVSPASGDYTYAQIGGTATGDCSSVLAAFTCTKTGGVSFAASATTDTTVATNISSGTLPAARLPNPSSSTLGGTQSKATVTSNFLTGISTSGVPSAAQPAFTDISGSVAAAQMPALTGDVTTSAGAVATTLATVGTGAGSCTNCSVTFDAKGRETAYSSGSAASSGLTKITTVTANNTGRNLDFTSGIDSTYNTYFIDCNGLETNGSNALPSFYVSEDAGSTWKTSYSFQGFNSVTGTLTSVNNTAAAQIYLNANSSLAIATTDYFEVQITIRNPSSTTQHKGISTRATWAVGTASGQAIYDGGYVADAGAITGFRIYNESANNYHAGQCTLYGLQK